ncbi:MAG: hexokinase [Spirochaetaceae bacterium]
MDSSIVKNTGKQAREFLLETGMHAENVHFDAILEAMKGEMDAGLSGGESSLAMIPTFIEAEREIPLNKKVLVLDAGGTNFRTALVSFDADGTPLVENYSKSPMPGSTGYVKRDEFFDSLADKAVHLWGSADSIGFCFSYPTEITPERDGKLLHFSKEIDAPEVEGEYVGLRLKEALLRAGAQLAQGVPHVVVLNDTVATLLAAKAAGGRERYGGYLGFILGTGLNCAYVEHNSVIGKIDSLPAGRSQIVNMESGGFDGFPGGRADEELDASTKSPGSYRMEKMVSGAYLGPLAHTLLKSAGENGLFSLETAERISSLPSVETAALDRFLRSPMEGTSSGIAAAFSGKDAEKDRLSAYILLDNIVERAGKLAALNISAAVIHGGSGENPSCPAAVCADGTTFYKTRRLQFYTQYYLKRELEERYRHYVHLVALDNAPLIGAAVAGLTN